jgi:8-oxo-dGTP pyrophosphatase MutT (NUDIX family)
VRIQLDRTAFGDRLEQRVADIAAGRSAPAKPRDAATVMVLRPASAGIPERELAGRGSAGIEVLMLRRTSAMKFAPGAYVFPGGSVDEADADPAIAWHGPDPAEVGARLGAPAELARALVCAAVRETFEESGVLLAGPDAGTVLATTGDAEWEADRRDLLAGTLSLAELLRRRGLVLRSDLLRPWARWITPVTEARRYDTRFFAAALPGGQRARDVSGEADETAWLEPAAALDAAARREISLFPPTAVTLGELRACGTVPAALAARRRMTALIPQVMVAEGAAWLTVPEGVEYPL